MNSAYARTGSGTYQMQSLLQKIPKHKIKLHIQAICDQSMTKQCEYLHELCQKFFSKMFQHCSLQVTSQPTQHCALLLCQSERVLCLLTPWIKHGDTLFFPSSYFLCVFCKCSHCKAIEI